MKITGAPGCSPYYRSKMSALGGCEPSTHAGNQQVGEPCEFRDTIAGCAGQGIAHPRGAGYLFSS
ncbi:MAG: hypothetical protein PHT49_03485 [Desulfovibrionales bacterium]|nr:hypothetical protein [Desulfovibrionales bacterium]